MIKKQGKAARRFLFNSLIAGLLLALVAPALTFSSLSVRAEEGDGVVTEPAAEDASQPAEENTSASENPSESPLDGQDGTDGSEGVPAEDPSQEPPAEEEGGDPDTVIETGDAAAVVVVDNTVNSNQTDAGDPCADCEDGAGNGSGTVTTDIEAENSASVGTAGDIDAISGVNEVAENTANVYIKTGDVDVFADIANYINTNIVGSDRIEVINIYDATGGVLDFSDFGAVLSETAAETLAMPETNFTHLNTTNDALVENDLDIDAVSGANMVSAIDGNVLIETGDVDVNASLFNAVNTNIVGNNWKFKIINIYSDWIGDIILPSLYTQYSSVGCGGCIDYLMSQTNNTSNISNTIAIDADSGSNRAESGGDDNMSVVLTGDAQASASVYNLTNANIIGDDWFYTNFNVNGWWHGSVYNTTPSVIRADIESNHIIAGALPSPEAPAQVSDVPPIQDYSSWYELTSNSTSTATVTNNIDIDAVSGGNLATTENGNAAIITGDVRARASVTNLVNTTIIGNNWQFILINVFGNWQGDLHYGMPDMAISEVAIPDALPIYQNMHITYLLSYTNGGDAPADDVVIRDRFDLGQLSVVDPNGGTVEDGIIAWNVGTIDPGETQVVSYQTQVTAPNGWGASYIYNTASVANDNSDRDTSNNTTGGVIEMAVLSTGQVDHSYWMADPDFSVQKSANKQEAHPGEKVDYRVTLKNHSFGNGFEVGVSDIMTDANGKEVSMNGWNLNTVYSAELIYLDYVMEVPAGAAPGEYTNEVIIYSKNRSGFQMPIVKAQHVLKVLPGAAADVVQDPFAALGFWGDLFGASSEPQNSSGSSDAAGVDGNATMDAQDVHIERSGPRSAENPSVLGAMLGIGDDGAPGQSAGVAPTIGDSPEAFGDGDRNRVVIAFVLVIVASILYYVVRKIQEPLSSDKLKV